MSKILTATLLFLAINSLQVAAFAQGNFTEANPCLERLRAQSQAVQS